jgi:protein-tyrosine phosphatase
MIFPNLLSEETWANTKGNVRDCNSTLAKHPHPLKCSSERMQDIRLAEAPRILFVCTGNICRSPMAEGVLRAWAPDWNVDSAATSDWHTGDPPDGRAIRIAAERGYDISQQRARQITNSDFQSFDLILGMDKGHLQKLGGEKRSNLRLLLSSAPETTEAEVPDPYYDNRFSHALDLIEAGVRGLIAHHGRS